MELELFDPKRSKVFTEDYFRCAIIGESGSGKTSFMKHIYDEYLKKGDIKYHKVIAFTQEHNAISFKKKFNAIIYSDLQQFDEYIARIKEFQNKNIKRYDKNGEPIYKYNLLLIFDDIVNSKFVSSPAMADLFATSRHIQCSIFFLIQKGSEVITTMIKNNCNIMVFTANNEYYSRLAIKNQYLKTGVSKLLRKKRKQQKDSGWQVDKQPTDTKLGDIAEEVIAEYLDDRDWNYLIYLKGGDLYYYEFKYNEK